MGPGDLLVVAQVEVRQRETPRAPLLDLSAGSGPD